MTTQFLVFGKNNTLHCPTYKSLDFQSCNCQSPSLSRSWSSYIHPPTKGICLRFILMLSSDVIGGDLWNWYWTFLFFFRFEMTGLLPWDYYHNNGCVYSWCGHTAFCLLCQDTGKVNKVQTNVKTVVCQLNWYWCYMQPASVSRSDCLMQCRLVQNLIWRHIASCGCWSDEERVFSIDCILITNFCALIIIYS